MKKMFALLALLTVTTVGPLTKSFAQSTTSGDVEGSVTDPTGAAIPGAKITVVNLTTGETKLATTSGGGTYRIALLPPGTYKVSVEAPGFSKEKNTVTVSAGSVSKDDLKLQVGQGTTTIEVTSEAQIVNTTNADVTTTFTAEQVQAMPNPGNDLTFVAQTAPGTVMNTGTAAGGYGNFSSFGISGLSNMFTLDGGYENDPFLNLNNTGASNLTLGNNEVDTVTVISPAYSSQYGGLGGAQVNEITASGGNRVHGNASYFWDGRVLNSNDFFNKQQEAFYGKQNIPAFVNANQWAASIGGPIIRNKLFWFLNTEGIRAITPVQGNINVPNSLAQACTNGAPGSTATQDNTVIPYDHYILNDYFGAGLSSDVSLGTYTQALLGTTGYTSCGDLNFSADTGAAAAYYNNNYNTGAPVPTNNAASVGFLGEGGIPFTAASSTNMAFVDSLYSIYNNSPLRRSAAIQSPTDPSANTYFAANSALLTEWLLMARVDYKIGDKDNFYIHYKQDHGIQPTYTDLLDPRFTASSKQPAWEGQMNESHTFTQNLVNQLVVTGNYYSAPFEDTNNYQPIEPFAFIPITGSYYGYGGENYAFPQGRNVSGYQVIDDVSWTKGRNTLRVGYNIRRDNITDIQGAFNVTPLALGSQEGFIGGTTDYAFEDNFPVRSTQPISVYNQGFYVEDAYKLTPQVTLTAGVRVERNSNPTCHTDCFSVLSAPVPTLALTNSGSLPYNAAFGGIVKGNRYRTFTGYQKAGVMPRIGVNYQVAKKTTLRAGFGMFTDTFPGVIADSELGNVPTQFPAVAYGYVSGAGSSAYDLNPASAFSGGNVAAVSATTFRTGYTAGTSYNSIANSVLNSTGALFAAPAFTTTAPFIKYPTYEEFSFAVEQQIDSKSSIAILYAGNHGYDEPVSDGSPNLANGGAGTGFFATVPTASPIVQFSSITNVFSGASSNYNGVVITGTRRSRDLTVQFNYEFSKALDMISNGGLEPFNPNTNSQSLDIPGDLAANYGLADYNVKHNVTGSFVYTLPAFFKNGWKKSAIGGIEFSGDAFHQSGMPYSITQSTSRGGAGISSSFYDGSVNLLAQQLNNNFNHHCGGGQHVTLPDGTVPNPCNFVNSFGNPTSFNTGQGRNSLIGPSYTNVNLSAFKTFGFNAPYFESMKLKLGAQFFNLFNHTNFGNPSNGRGANNSGLGGISRTVGAPTSILGSVGGADASPRLIQLHAVLTF